MANYDQRMDYGVSSPSSIKENTSSISGLADSGFDTFDLSTSPAQSPDFDDYPLTINGHSNPSPEIFDPLKPIQENGDPPNLLDMDFFDPLAPLPEEFPSPENTSSPNISDKQDYEEQQPTSNGSLPNSPIDFFSRTVDPDASLNIGGNSSTASDDGGSMSEALRVPSGSLSKERDSGAECDSLDDELQQRGSPNILLPTYQKDEQEHGSDNEQMHVDDAPVDTGYKNKINAMKGKKKELDPPTNTSSLEIKVKRSKTEVKMKTVSVAEKENVNLVQQKPVPQKQVPVSQRQASVTQKENSVNTLQKQVTTTKKETVEMSPSPVHQYPTPEVTDVDHEQFLDEEQTETLDGEMKENIGIGVSVDHLKNSFINGFDHNDDYKDDNNDKQLIVTGVDIRTLRENYCQNSINEDADKYKEKIQTGVSIKDLRTSYVAASRFQDSPASQRARSVGDLTREESRTSLFPLGVSVQALRASYCDLIKLDENKARERLNIKTGVSIKSLKTSFISNGDATTNGEQQPGVKIDRAKITRSFSQENYPLYALLDTYDGVMSRDEQTNLCRICGRPVFLMDRIKAEKSVFHRTCFRCKECNKQLTVDSYCSHETVLYCKSHFKLLFQPKANFEEETNIISRRKHEDPIKENIPMELPPDVVRSSDKPDHGLEDIPSLKNIKSRFETNEDEVDGDLERGVSQISVKRSESILTKMAKFQADGNENGHYEDSSESENEITDPDVIRETKKKEKSIASNEDENEEVVFTGMTDLKSQWEKGADKSKEEEWAKETQEELNKLRQKICQGKGSVKAVYENALQEMEKSPGKEGSFSTEISSETKSILEKWERGEVLNENEKDKLNHFNKEKEEDLSVFRESGLNEARNLFKKIDETVSKTGTPLVFNKSPSVERTKRSTRESSGPVDTEIVRSTNQKEEIIVDSTNLQEKFKFFENYQDPAPQTVERKRFTMTPPRDAQPEDHDSDHDIPRDPNVVRSCDHEQEIVTDTARKMLNKFRELEIQRTDDFAPAGPKPLKRITPPREYTAVYDDERDSSPEPERDPNIVRSSDKIEDMAVIEAAKARNLRAKFENWANEDDEDDDYSRSYDDGQPSIDTTKNLKAKFEALREESARANSKPNVAKVNRFVDPNLENCAICLKKLYPMETMETNNQRIHKACFRCCQCASPLRLDNYTASEGTFYCTPHYTQLFKLRGNYDEGFGREQHKEKWNRSRSTTPNRSRSTTPVTGTNEYNETTEEIYA